MMTCAQLAKLLGGEVRNGEVLCPGPRHSSEDRSLSVKLDKDASDGFVCHSFAGDDPITCRDHVREKLGLPPFKAKKKKNGKAGAGAAWTTLAEHIYRDEHGVPYLLVRNCRDSNGRKQYPQYHRDGQRWAKGKPEGPKIPYRLPELVGAPVTTVVYFCEGEKDAESLAKIGLVATTASEGANAAWAPELTPYFKDRRVVILPDADLIGRKHGSKIARALAPVAKSVKVVDLFPGCHDGSDVSDWLQTDTAGIKLIKAVNDAPLWDPASTERDTAGANKTSANDNAEIERLAKLPRNG